MPPVLAAVLAAAVLAAPLPGQARDNVVMVNIDYFAESHRMTGENAARLAIATGKPEMYMAFGEDMWSANVPGGEQRARAIEVRKKVIRAMGIVPRPYTGGGCIIDPAGDAYASGYGKIMDTYFKQRFGADYAASIETEVARRMKAAPQRRR
jgi:hypothetical protein